MKQQRELEKNPPYKHTCQCLSADEEYLKALPEESSCVNPRYFERQKDNTWKDVTEKVTLLPY